MMEYILFMLKLPLLIFLISIVIAIFNDSSDLVLEVIKIFSWPFMDGAANDVFSRKFAIRLGIAVLGWICIGTALFFWLKYGHFDTNFWNFIMGVDNIHHIRGVKG
jgi:hypothetical protein